METSTRNISKLKFVNLNVQHVPAILRTDDPKRVFGRVAGSRTAGGVDKIYDASPVNRVFAIIVFKIIVCGFAYSLSASRWSLVLSLSSVPVYDTRPKNPRPGTTSTTDDFCPDRGPRAFRKDFQQDPPLYPRKFGSAGVGPVQPKSNGGPYPNSWDTIREDRRGNAVDGETVTRPRTIKLPNPKRFRTVITRGLRNSRGKFRSGGTCGFSSFFFVFRLSVLFLAISFSLSVFLSTLLWIFKCSGARN